MSMDALSHEAERRLRAVLVQARGLVPPGAPVVAVPSLRTLHAVRAVQGEVLPLVLASHAFAHAGSGGALTMDSPWVLVVDGVLDERHLPDLLPHMEQAVASRAQLVVAAADFDDVVLGTLVVNHQRKTLGVAALAPPDPADTSALRRLAVLAQSSPAAVDGDRLRGTSLGTLPSLLMTAHHAVAIGARGAGLLALIHAGGETPEEARAAASRLRAMA
jgi:hypothetical protein